jgi:hypothetical protein
MPNGGIDNCGLCGFNRANEGVWDSHEIITDERLKNAFCTLRGVKVSVPMWSYCRNFKTKETVPHGPICTVALIEEKPGWLYARIPWHGDCEPKLHVAGTCGCGRTVSWISAGAGVRSGVSFTYVVWMTEETAVELYIDTGDKEENKRIFDGLHAKKPEIEQAFGAPMLGTRRFPIQRREDLSGGPQSNYR